MNAHNDAILGVPTNIITGFLGVGKTSAIMHLLANKPKHERWAVLVNEFGEIGVDGSLVEGLQLDQQIFIREVTGGCMCCSAGLPMKVALNQLLSKAKPDRLLIEPTGLGHPKEVMEVLSSEHYQTVLTLQQNITLVDARKLSDPRYTNHDTFNQQIAIADTVVGNKVDLYQAGDIEKLEKYVAAISQPNTKVLFSQHGAISVTDLEGAMFTQDHSCKKPKDHVHDHDHHAHDSHEGHHHNHHAHDHNKPLASEATMPDSGVVKAVNQGEGFYSVGWRFSADKVFDQEKLQRLLASLKIERMKAVMITDKGIVGYNLTSDGLTENTLESCSESRIELIAESIDKQFELTLLDCIKPSKA